MLLDREAHVVRMRGEHVVGPGADAVIDLHVLLRASAGSALHVRALQMVDPVERMLIEATCGWWPGQPE